MKTILECCAIRLDNLGFAKKGRIEFYRYDLHAAGCLYYHCGDVNFRSGLAVSRRGVASRGEIEDPTFKAKVKAKAKNLQKSEAEDRLFEDRPSRGQGKEWSRPRTKDTSFLN